MKKPGSIEHLVGSVLKKLIKKGRPSAEQVASAWAAAAGESAAKHSQPVSFKRSTLVVNVDGSAWLYELSTHKREILEKLAAELSGKKLKDIRFRIGAVKRA